jgi:hypothetical protein
VSDDNGRRRPLLRVISGEATDEEVAAILAVVMARCVEESESRARSAETSTWADPGARHRGVHGVPAPGRDGWRTSCWPR